MFFDLAELDGAARGRLVNSIVTPRPIAWISTHNGAGRLNAAPFSFFNAVSSDPPVLAVGIQPRAPGVLKDTARNIRDTGEFVVNLVSTACVSEMSATSFAYPEGVDELALVGTDTLPSHHLTAPRIAAAPASFECRLLTAVDLGRDRTVFLGEIVAAHVRDSAVLDAAAHRFDPTKLDLVARMHGSDWYVRSTDLFQVARPLTAIPPAAD